MDAGMNASMNNYKMLENEWINKKRKYRKRDFTKINKFPIDIQINRIKLIVWRIDGPRNKPQ